MDAVRHKALFIRLGGLGDLLVALPSIAYLRRAFPGFYISLLCRSEYGVLLQAGGLVDEILSAGDRTFSFLFSGTIAEPEPVRRLKDFSIVFAWLHKADPSAIEAAVRILGIERAVLIAPGDVLPPALHRFFFRETLSAVGRDPDSDSLFAECARLPLRKGMIEEGLKYFGLAADSAPRGYAVVHPGSGSAAKCWPLENFLYIVRELSRAGIPGILLTGEAEESLAKVLKEAILPEGWKWFGSPPLTMLPGLLTEARLYLGNDSGVTHLAAACGAPVVALFRKEWDPVWKPYGKTRSLSSAFLSEISPCAVWDAVSNLL
jgi:ADP-heptose:LPS heptosyltransferase